MMEYGEEPVDRIASGAEVAGHHKGFLDSIGSLSPRSDLVTLNDPTERISSHNWRSKLNVKIYVNVFGRFYIY